MFAKTFLCLLSYIAVVTFAVCDGLSISSSTSSSSLTQAATSAASSAISAAGGAAALLPATGANLKVDYFLTITDSNFASIKPILKYLPPAEQTLLLGCYTANTDSSRFFSTSCYRQGVEGVLFSQSSQAIAANFTANSVKERTGLSCITAFLNTYKTGNDTAIYSNISATLGALLTQQATFNNFQAGFVTIFNQIMDGRRRYLITTTSNIVKEAVTVNSTLVGFDFPNTEVAAIILLFKAYCRELAAYNSYFSQQVITAQSLITKLSACATNTTANNTNVNSTMTLSNIYTNLYSNPTFQSVLNYTLLQMTLTLNIDWIAAGTLIQNAIYTNATNFKPQPELHRRLLGRIQNGDLLTQEFNKGLRGDSCSGAGTYILVCNSVSLLCYCNSNDCPSSVKGAASITLNPLGATFNSNITTNSSTTTVYIGQTTNTLVDISSFYISTGCVSGMRILYSQMSDTIGNNFFDYLQGGYLGFAVGSSANSQAAICANVFNAGLSNATQCRGNMSTTCASNLDSTCNRTGLYSYMVANPPVFSPFPIDCNDALSTYSISACFTWIADRLFRGTMVLSVDNLNNLTLAIQASVNGAAVSTNGGTYTTSSTDSTTSDPSSQVNGTVSDSDFTVDGSTNLKITNPNNYVNDLNSQSYTTQNSANWINRISSVLFSIFLISLF